MFYINWLCLASYIFFFLFPVDPQLWEREEWDEFWTLSFGASGRGLDTNTHGFPRDFLNLLAHAVNKDAEN